MAQDRHADAPGRQFKRTLAGSRDSRAGYKERTATALLEIAKSEPQARAKRATRLNLTNSFRRVLRGAFSSTRVFDCGPALWATVVTRSPDRMPENYRSERLQVSR